MDVFEQNAASIKSRMAATVKKLKADLEPWIDQHSWPTARPESSTGDIAPAYYTEVSIALLETAIDRYIRLHGLTDARNLVTTCFEHCADQHRKSLQ